MARLLLAMALFALVGCATYSPGDGVGTALELQKRYCDNADPRSRAVTLALMYRAGIELPPEGACTDILEVLNGDIHTRAPKD